MGSCDGREIVLMLSDVLDFLVNGLGCQADERLQEKQASADDG